MPRLALQTNTATGLVPAMSRGEGNCASHNRRVSRGGKTTNSVERWLSRKRSVNVYHFVRQIEAPHEHINRDLSQKRSACHSGMRIAETNSPEL